MKLRSPLLFRVLSKNLFARSFVFNVNKMIETKSSDSADHLGTENKTICPPKQVKGMMELDRDAFRKTIQVPYVVTNVNNLPQVVRNLKSYMLKIPHLKPVQSYGSDNSMLRKIYLNPDLFDEHLKEKIESISEIQPEGSAKASKLMEEPLELTYDNFTYHAIFRAILPEELDTISGFSTIGHIIHLNLRDDALPYKKIVGQV